MHIRRRGALGADQETGFNLMKRTKLPLSFLFSTADQDKQNFICITYIIIIIIIILLFETIL